MPTRLTHIRTSYRPKTTVKDPKWLTHDDSWLHTKWMVLDSLIPMSGDEIQAVARAGYDANWRGKLRAKPVVADGSRLVTFVDGEQELVLEVRKRNRLGRYQIVLLKEVGDIQS